MKFQPMVVTECASTEKEGRHKQGIGSIVHKDIVENVIG